MISRCRYGILRIWMAIACLALLPLFTSAQSDFNADTVIQDYESAHDTAYASEQINNDKVLTFRSTPDSVIHGLQQQKEFAYANDPKFWEEKERQPRPSRQQTNFWDVFFGILQYVLFGVFIVVLIYILIRILSDSKIILFKRKKNQIPTSEEEAVPEGNDLRSLIIAAETQQQYRMATRYRYVQLLESMNERQLIRMHSELTNWDYIRQMGSHPLVSRFRYLTLAYEYVWYGEFEPGNEQYSQIRNKFETFFH